MALAAGESGSQRSRAWLAFQTANASPHAAQGDTLQVPAAGEVARRVGAISCSSTSAGDQQDPEGDVAGVQEDRHARRRTAPTSCADHDAGHEHRGEEAGAAPPPAHRGVRGRRTTATRYIAGHVQPAAEPRSGSRAWRRWPGRAARPGRRTPWRGRGASPDGNRRAASAIDAAQRRRSRGCSGRVRRLASRGRRAAASQKLAPRPTSAPSQPRPTASASRPERDERDRGGDPERPQVAAQPAVHPASRPPSASTRSQSEASSPTSTSSPNAPCSRPMAPICSMIAFACATESSSKTRS